MGAPQREPKPLRCEPEPAHELAVKDEDRRREAELDQPKRDHHARELAHPGGADRRSGDAVRAPCDEIHHAEYDDRKRDGDQQGDDRPIHAAIVPNQAGPEGWGYLRSQSVVDHQVRRCRSK